jgi:hypothetical protein
VTSRRFYAGLLVLAVTFAGVRSARAGSDDIAALATVQQVMSDDYPTAAFGEAKRKLTEALEKCKQRHCNANTRAQVLIALGMVMSQLGSGDEARAQFAAALQQAPNAHLPSSGTTPNIRTQFADAQKTVGVGQPAPTQTQAAPPPPPPPPTQTAAPPPPPPPVDTSNVAAQPAPTQHAGRIPGWNSTEAFELASAGLTADLAGKLDECIAKDKKSLELEEQPRTRLHLASCERRSGHLIDALRDTQKALEDGIKKRDAPVMRAARERVEDLLARIPHVTFVPPAGVTDLNVTFDDRAVPQSALTKKFSIDPGSHKVHAEGTQNGIPLAFDETYNVKEGELLTVTITLKSQTSEYLTPGQLKCMLSAKNQEEVVHCLPQNQKNLVVKAGFDFSGYTDTNSVNVVTPSINAQISSPTAGWNVGGSFLFDVVTAASPDIVSMASPAFRDRRYAGVLTGGYKPKTIGIQANAAVSIENDYDSFSGGIAATADLRDKLVTPRIAYNFSHDIIGRTGTPFSVFSHELDTHELEAGVTMVLSPTTLLSIAGTAQFERGDQSKPYRYIPMFTPDIAARIPVGATIDLVNQYRLPMRPLEQLPTSRDRYALGLRLAKRFGSMNATLRLDQRVYYDTWGTAATTTDARWVQDVGKRFRFWPHVRLNAQTGASFYQLAYAAILNADGSLTLPLYRSDDRELGPLITLTGGGGLRFGLTSPDSKTQIGLNVAADLMYTRFFEALFVTTRTAAYGTVGMDFEFD